MEEKAMDRFRRKDLAYEYDQQSDELRKLNNDHEDLKIRHKELKSEVEQDSRWPWWVWLIIGLIIGSGAGAGY